MTTRKIFLLHHNPALCESISKLLLQRIFTEFESISILNSPDFLLESHNTPSVLLVDSQYYSTLEDWLSGEKSPAVICIAEESLPQSNDSFFMFSSDVSPVELADAVYASLLRQRLNDGQITADEDGHKRLVPLEDIYCISRREKSVTLLLDQKSLDSEVPFDIVNLLLRARGFFLTFPGILVHTKYILSIESNSLLLKNNSRVPLDLTKRNRLIQRCR